jgi:hypothetical protein
MSDSETWTLGHLDLGPTSKYVQNEATRLQSADIPGVNKEDSGAVLVLVVIMEDRDVTAHPGTPLNRHCPPSEHCTRANSDSDPVSGTQDD